MSNNQVLGSGEIKASGADERLQEEDRACLGSNVISLQMRPE